MKSSDHQMYDLHGLSESEAEALVAKGIRQAEGSDMTRIRFVTGRGNHVNAKGNRATLFNAFPEWLKASPFADRIHQIHTFDGYYEVEVKPTLFDTRFLDLRQKVEKQIFGSAEVINNFRRKADLGDPEAMVLYAELLESGKYVERNVVLSAEYIRKAAKIKKYPMAMHAYARCWLIGIGVRQSDAKAQKWLWRAHAEKYIPSTLTLAKSYQRGLPGYPFDIPKAIELHAIAAAANETDSMRFFGSIYSDGTGVTICQKTSFDWYMKAAKLGDAIAQYNVAVMLRNGSGVTINESESEKYFEMSARGGDRDAQFHHAINLMRKGGKTNKEQATMWLFTAADNGSEVANEYISRLVPDSKEFLKRSAKAGNLNSQQRLDKLNGLDKKFEDYSLGEIKQQYRHMSDNEVILLHLDGRYQLLDRMLLEGEASDRRSAFGCIQSMARQACPFAMRRSIYYLLRGDGVLKIQKNIPRVLELLEASIKEEDPIAMVQLGLLLVEGKYIKKQLTRAKKLFHRAAELKYPPAFYHLGMTYEKGSSGKSMPDEATQCYNSAIKYEALPGHIQKFVKGPLDQYQYVCELSKAGVDRLKPLVKKTVTSSVVTPGFFSSENSAKQKSVDSPVKSKHMDSQQPPVPVIVQKPVEILAQPDVTENKPITIPEPVSLPLQSASWGSLFTPKNVLIGSALIVATIVSLSK